MQIVALRLCKLHFGQRHVEDVLATQCTGLDLNEDVVTSWIPASKT